MQASIGDVACFNPSNDNAMARRFTDWDCGSIMIKFAWPSLLSPVWRRTGFFQSRHVGVVVSETSLQMYGCDLELSEGVLPPPGTTLVMSFNSKDQYIRGETEAEWETRIASEKAFAEEQRKLREAREKSEREAYLVRREERAKSENAQLLIPVRWTSGRKTVLSGLSANSNGDGQNARTVTHVLLLDEISEGRFKRRANSFLCTSASGSDGQGWTGQLWTNDRGVSGPHVSCITCQSCLKLAKRWENPHTAIKPELITEDMPSMALPTCGF